MLTANPPGHTSALAPLQRSGTLVYASSVMAGVNAATGAAALAYLASGGGRLPGGLPT